MNTTNTCARPTLASYAKAMRSGDVDSCIEIEQSCDLYGLPPELVTIGLIALDEGNDVDAAIQAYMTTGHAA